MTEIEKFQISMELGATFSINGGQAWTKPGVATSITFSDIPNKEDVDTALKFMQHQILEPTMSDVADAVIKYTKRANGIEE
jgi:hypothetical protein